MDLANRRKEIVEEHKNQETYNDHWRSEAAKGNRLTDRLIAFLVDDTVVVLAADVPKLVASLKKFIAAHGPIFANPDVAKARGHDYYCFKHCERIVNSSPTGDLHVHQQVWNAVSFGLAEVGVICSTSDGTFGPNPQSPPEGITPIIDPKDIKG